MTTIEMIRTHAAQYRGLDLAIMGDRIKDWRARKGFVTDVSNLNEKMMLIVTELAEAMEDYRDGRLTTTFTDDTLKPIGVASELADVAIRIMDVTSSLGINIIGLPNVEESWRLPAAPNVGVDVPAALLRIVRTLSGVSTDMNRMRHYVLALALIQTCELASMIGANIQEEIALKMGFNETRPHKHGRNC